MKQDKIMLVILLVCLVFLASTFLFFGVSKEEEKVKETDTIKLKNEYENLNGKINDENKRAYPIVNVKESISFKIVDESTLIDLFSHHTGLVFLGSSKESFSRTLFQLFNQSLEEMPLEEVYYLDVLNIKEEIGLDDRDETIVKQEGTSGYYQLMEILKDYLPNVSLLNKNNEYIETKQKEIFCPTIVAFVDGHIVGVHIKTVDSQKTGYDLLTVEEENELKNTIKNLIMKVKEGL